MAGTGEGGVLGRQAPPIPAYSPDILESIPRSDGRDNLPAQQLLGMHGQDVWHAYEVSWLGESGRPEARVGRLVIPADAPFVPESKSFKLYLNSLNGEQMGSDGELAARIVADLERVIEMPVQFSLFPVDAAEIAGARLRGECLDSLPVQNLAAAPSPDFLHTNGPSVIDQSVHSHLFRSLCPVTGQPDWATVRVTYSGQTIAPESLLRYLLSFREHQEFHEQCAERIYCDIATRCAPKILTVEAFFARRGGLDINPVRSSESDLPAPRRLIRQ
ncbi:MAG: NADPH-dependent 7-cyano-7-deazaguanine reductase QueF [Halioglobus sp.]|nr:NADPH-dependent 7-cyano-7-deazaguanine reductase QueF [Halioglobus sp.]